MVDARPRRTCWLLLPRMRASPPVRSSRPLGTKSERLKPASTRARSGHERASGVTPSSGPLLRKGGYARVLGGDVSLGCMGGSAGGSPGEFNGSPRCLGGLRSDRPRCLSGSPLHKTMDQHSSHPQRDACSSTGVDNFTRLSALGAMPHTSTAGTSREQATVEHNRPQQSSASRDFTLGAVTRSY